MALSALRVRLTVGFAAAFAAAFFALDVALLVQRTREGEAALAKSAVRVADGVAAAIARELSEPETANMPLASREALREWPADGAGIAIVAGLRDSLAVRPAMAGVVRARVERRVQGQDAHIVVALSGVELDAEIAALRRIMWVLSPLLLLLAGAAGYLLARWSLAPVHDLQAQIVALGASEGAARLEAAARADEVGDVARGFNGLLDRLDASRRRNRAFVEAAAHQLRTPLTLVRGEADLALATPGAPREALAEALSRISRAGEQMHRRVDDLALVAEAQATRGIEAHVALDLAQVARDGVELMARRATAAGTPLALEVARAPVLGDARLLREAVIELIENACRHATPGAVVNVRVAVEGVSSVLSVESAGAPFEAPARALDDDGPERRHLGLAIVRWIAEAHGGTLRLSRTGDRTRVALVLAAVPLV